MTRTWVTTTKNYVVVVVVVVVVLQRRKDRADRRVSNQSRVRYLSQSRFLFHLFLVVVVVFHEPSSF